MIGPAMGSKELRRPGWRDAMAAAPATGRVLIVDDDPAIRLSIGRLVTKLGFSSRVAASAEEADALLAAERFEVCLLDIELPRMTGVEFLSWALRRDPEMAVIMTTGVDVADVAIECIDRGARTYLVKPLDAAFLRLALRDAMAMRRLLVERNDLLDLADPRPVGR